MLNFTKYQWLSFDCYGTLIDWETGITNAVARFFARHGVRKSREEILALFASSEPRVQSSGEFLDYRRVLRDVMQIMAWEAGIRLTAADAGALPDSLPQWPIFPEAPDALKRLQSRYRLAIISNVDDDLFRQSEEVLGVRFDSVVTSQQARVYKPNLGGFDLALQRMGIAKEQWLHVGESLYHDIGPANLSGHRQRLGQPPRPRRRHPPHRREALPLKCRTWMSWRIWRCLPRRPAPLGRSTSSSGVHCRPCTIIGTQFQAVSLLTAARLQR